jgi:hypothetical protein
MRSLASDSPVPRDRFGTAIFESLAQNGTAGQLFHPASVNQTIQKNSRYLTVEFKEFLRRDCAACHVGPRPCPVGLANQLRKRVFRLAGKQPSAIRKCHRFPRFRGREGRSEPDFYCAGERILERKRDLGSEQCGGRIHRHRHDLFFGKLHRAGQPAELGIG